ncbi:hypothetical protein N7471_004561 [Penicillium samsonianum]|uniref:uncharacterized protein n=1 Tax=Penicillium samsonianum TaxID=1882272 RepID=UPI002547F3AC|nr:uncharacterized protein N7471_004561 [Penicillium samsonianum]KAJ6138075.1 hypothetical protein N7471_004561 [Penicillium samsonianum]
MELHVPNTGGANSIASVLAICTLHSLASVLEITLVIPLPPTASWSKASDLLFNLVWFCCYATARWGSVILMFISLRALPAASYITVNWLSSIPHI